MTLRSGAQVLSAADEPGCLPGSSAYHASLPPTQPTSPSDDTQSAAGTSSQAVVKKEAESSPRKKAKAEPATPSSTGSEGHPVRAFSPYIQRREAAKIAAAKIAAAAP